MLPRNIHNKKNQNTPELQQENKDANKLGAWKNSLKGQGYSKCSDQVRDYLDEHLPGWRIEKDFYEQALQDAKDIVSRKDKRPNLLPRIISNKENRNTPELIQENKDATKLSEWKKALKGQGHSKCSNEVRDYLDEHLPGWRTKLDEQSLQDAKDIVSRKNKRPNLLPRYIIEKNRNTPELIQENKDAAKLGNWKKVLKGEGHCKCSNEVRDYLDKNLPGWRIEKDFDEQALQDAKDIVSRKDKRPNLLPRNIHNKKNRNTQELEQENKDATKLGHWKKALKGKGGKCSNEVRDYLDEHLPGWRIIDDNSETQSIASDTQTIEDEEIIIIPKKKSMKHKEVKEKSYEDMTENERRDFIEKHLQKQKDKKGYNSTNPDDKDALNKVFSENISSENEGKIVFLDHIEFKTAYSLLEAGIKPEDMIIPQRAENYSEMIKHEIFGNSVVLEEFNDTLNRLENEKIKIKGVYADYCSTLEKDGIPFLELMSKIKVQDLLCQDAILGVTITLRNPEGVRFQGQDITIMEKKILKTFPNSENMLLKSKLTPDDEAYTYGNGAPMATWIFKVNI